MHGGNVERETASRVQFKGGGTIHFVHQVFPVPVVFQLCERLNKIQNLQMKRLRRVLSFWHVESWCCSAVNPETLLKLVGLFDLITALVSLSFAHLIQARCVRRHLVMEGDCLIFK